MPKPVILLILIAICGGGGFALGEISQMAAEQRRTGATSDQEAVIFSAGQFTIPLFDGGRVPYFLLAEVNITVQTYDEVSLLHANRPAVRATVLETFFELERRGEIKPENIKPEVITAAIQADLESTFDVKQVSGVLLNRLLIQETGGSVRN